MGDVMVSLSREIMRYFPYPSVRPGQDELMKLVNEAVRKRKTAIVEAMSGFGKTVAILSGILPLAEEENLKVLYFARTHKEHERVIEEVKRISRSHDVKAIALRGRREMCLLREVRDIKDYRVCLDLCKNLRSEGSCPYYVSFLSSFNLCTKQLRDRSSSLTAEDLIMFGIEHGICPYEIAKSLLREANVIACSYVYLLNKEIFGKFMRHVGTSLDDAILVLDEAHNIPELATDSMSDTISHRALVLALRESMMELKSAPLTAFIKALLRTLSKFRSMLSSREGVIPKDIIERIAMETVHVHLEDVVYLIKDASDIVKERLAKRNELPRSHLSRLSKFLEIWNEALYSDHYLCVIRSNDADFTLTVLSLDPSPLICPLIEGAYATVLTSATLEPLHAFADVLGIDRGKCVLRSIKVRLPDDKLLIIGMKGVSTDFKHRSPSMYRKLVSRISEILESAPGNIGIFTASYEVLEGLLKAGLEDVSRGFNKPLYIERPDATSADNDRLIKEFKAHAKKGGAVLLGVQGGRNAEGEDFPGREMSLAVIVGVPYAKPTPIVKERIRYFEKKFPGKGKLYSYILPAIRKSLQAAGRPFRGTDDKSAIIFLDYRFLQRPCKALLPEWIKKRMRVLPDKEGELTKELLLFFGSGS